MIAVPGLLALAAEADHGCTASQAMQSLWLAHLRCLEASCHLLSGRSCTYCLQEFMQLSMAQLAALAQTGNNLFGHLRALRAQRNSLAGPFMSVSSPLWLTTSSAFMQCLLHVVFEQWHQLCQHVSLKQNGLHLSWPCKAMAAHCRLP